MHGTYTFFLYLNCSLADRCCYKNYTDCTLTAPSENTQRYVIHKQAKKVLCSLSISVKKNEELFVNIANLKETGCNKDSHF